MIQLNTNMNIQFCCFPELDIVPFLVTALVCLFWSLEYGMVCGIAVNALFILYKSARPKIQICLEKCNSLTIGIVQVQENICYSSAEYLKSKVIKFVNTQGGDGSVKLIIIKGDEITNIDATVALVSLKTFVKLQEIY